MTSFAGSPLAGTTRFLIPKASVLEPTVHALHDAGRSGNEAFAVWAGVVDDSTVRFTRCIIPDQTPQRTPRGLLVTVSGAALNEINRDCYQRGELMAGQVHTHPTEAYHSDTDDHFPLVTLLGALSIVIPDFARLGTAGIRQWAFYRLAGRARWQELTRQDKVDVLP